MFYGVSLKV